MLVRYSFLLFLLIEVSCALGPTPECVGFSYPEAGIRFSPRRHVVSRAKGTEISVAHPEAFTLLFPRIVADVEGQYRRILFSGVAGEWKGSSMPLFDEIGINYYGSKLEYSYQLTEERAIQVPWPGLASKSGTLRVFHMTPLPDSGGTAQYTFAVTVLHFGNTFEVCWREARDKPPDEQKLEEFFYWTHGLRFFEPRKNR